MVVFLSSAAMKLGWGGGGGGGGEGWGCERDYFENS